MTWWALTYRQSSSPSPAPDETNRISYVHADVCTTQWWDGGRSTVPSRRCPAQKCAQLVGCLFKRSRWCIHATKRLVLDVLYELLLQLQDTTRSVLTTRRRSLQRRAVVSEVRRGVDRAAVRKWAVFVAVPLALVFAAGCRNSHKLDQQSRAAVAVAIRHTGGVAPFPRKNQAKECLLPPPGSSSDPEIRATCETQVSDEGNATRVRLIQSWDWRAFRYRGTPKRRQSHTWEFLVRDDGNIVRAREYGDFPPQNAH
jgi:hypothetical protein